MGSVTHFEIYGEQPAALADFYCEALGWNVEQMLVRQLLAIQTGATEGPGFEPWPVLQRPTESKGRSSCQHGAEQFQR